jgi:uncharacterized glyoxalase superfamily protein PhnB
VSDLDFCDEVDDYCQEIKKNGAVIKVEPADQPYGMRDFIVLDPDGNHMTFGCAIRRADQEPQKSAENAKRRE